MQSLVRGAAPRRKRNDRPASTFWRPNACHIALAATALWAAARPATAQTAGPGPQRVTVAAPTRLDWIYPLANQSPAEPPADWLKGYDGKAEYDVFVPPGTNPKTPMPLVLFISPSASPAGWQQWQAVCRQYRVAFASPVGAGNDCPGPQRVRIVFDVLDDIRRKMNVDPNRTYLAGFSGGARMACRIAFAEPELFGGVVANGGAENLRDESWLRSRALDRLSVAYVAGETDFNRAELERFREPLVREVGGRTKLWIVPKLGHGIPDGAKLAEVLQFLEAGAAERAKKALAGSTYRIAGNEAPTREEWSAKMLAEAKKRLAKPATTYDGLMQLQVVAVRWNDLPAGKAAGELLAEYDARGDRPWEADDLAEQRKFLVAEARALGDYAAGPLPQQYEGQRGAMAAAALERWRVIAADDPGSVAGREAPKRIAALEPLAKEK
jgi:predicted esterase